MKKSVLFMNSAEQKKSGENLNENEIAIRLYHICTFNSKKESDQKTNLLSKEDSF